MSVALANVVPSSAAPALSLLDEPEPLLRAHALRSLDALADAYWPEISSAVDKIQELSEDETFPERGLASIVAAKVNFHLGSLDDALHYALAAGKLFNVDEQTQFAITLRARCIDEYISLKVRQSEQTFSGDKPSFAGGSSDHAFAAELEAVVERVVAGCIEKGEIREAIGVALESHRLDKVEKAILEGCKTDEARSQALAYCFDCAQTLVASRGYRAKVLKLISDIHIANFPSDKRDHIAVANCKSFIGDAKGVANVLMTLVREACVSSIPEKKDELELTALQIAFDIVDNDAPFFASQITALLPEPKSAVPPQPVPSERNGNASEANPSSGAAGPVPMESDAITPVRSDSELSPEDKLVTKLRKILSGTVTAALSLDFLCSHNRSDTFLLKKIKQGLDGRSSVCHSALVFANAIAHSGTAIDQFLRENLDWLARATAWAKFSATSCLGVIHSRHTSSALNLLSPYLPSSGGSSSASSASSYSEGGALYALGLISATGGRDVLLPSGAGSDSTTAKAYLLQALNAAGTNEVVKHGASLGLGLAAMASWDGGDSENEYYEELKSLLFTDTAVGSEGAAFGMGLIALGSGSEKVCDEMLAYARETEHEKIVRGLAVGMALICYGCQDDADNIIQKLNSDKDPILRYGAMYAIALAYCGTADNKAIKMLLHSAVADISDDVRRAAVIALGFVLFRHPKQVPRIVALLSESCHAHVRYGAAMAIGIACMGTGMPVAVEILERLSADSTDFVRQGALIGLALVFMHHTEARSPKVSEIRKLFEITWSAKLEDAVARFGAVVASGIIDVGGKNGIISFTSANGHPRMSSIVGMAMFTQFWYWYPLVHFIGLSIRPAALVAVNGDLKMPKLSVVSNYPAAIYDYVPSNSQEKSKEIQKAPAAILSVTGKSKSREARRAAKRKAENAVSAGANSENTEGPDAMSDADPVKDNIKDGKDSKVGDSKESEDKNTDPYAILENPCRVLPAQEPYINWEMASEPNGTSIGGSTTVAKRYVPVMKGRNSGIVLVRDLRKGDPEDYVEMTSLSTSAPPPPSTASTGRSLTQLQEEEEVSGDEVSPPEPFVYTDENEDESAKEKEQSDKDSEDPNAMSDEASSGK